MAKVRKQAGVSSVSEGGGVVIYGTENDDVINPRRAPVEQSKPTPFDDEIFGEGGNDKIDGGLGADTMYGGTGDDTFYIDNAGDTVIEFGDSEIPSRASALVGGGGRDKMISSTVNVVLADNVEDGQVKGLLNLAVTGNALDNRLTGNDGDNELSGGEGNDRLTGKAGADTLNGELGNDRLNGGTGNDTVNGGDGEDSLNGGQGADTLNGGSGADRFVFDKFTQADGLEFLDTIEDFSSYSSEGDGDLIVLAGIDANGNSEDGNQKFVYRGELGFTGAGGEVRWASDEGPLRVEMDTNGDMEADIVILVDGVFSLNAGDFVL